MLAVAPSASFNRFRCMTSHMLLESGPMNKRHRRSVSDTLAFGEFGFQYDTEEFACGVDDMLNDPLTQINENQQ